MWRETNIFGVYMSPFVVYMIAAFMIHLPLRLLLARLGFFRWVWNKSLAAAGIYVCILGVLAAWF
jgi:hypothetical protein